MYVYIYIYIYIYIYMHTHEYEKVCRSLSLCLGNAKIHVSKHVFMFVCMRSHTCTYTHTWQCIGFFQTQPLDNLLHT